MLTDQVPDADDTVCKTCHGLGVTMAFDSNGGVCPDCGPSPSASLNERCSLVIGHLTALARDPRLTPMQRAYMHAVNVRVTEAINAMRCGGLIEEDILTQARRAGLDAAIARAAMEKTT